MIKQNIHTRNLLESESHYQCAQEKRDLHLREFWKEITAECGNSISVLSRDEILARYRMETIRISAFDSSKKKISFAREIASFLDIHTLIQRVVPEYKSRDASATIAFWQENNDSAEAYECFKHLFKTADPLYTKRFGDVCEAILNEDADFGIIPIENSSDGKLFGFYRMLERSDLIICATHDVEHADKDLHTKYALVSKHAFYFEEIPFIHLELSFYLMNSDHLFELMNTIEALDIKIEQINSLPPHHQTTENRIYTVISVNRATLPVFLCYLWLFETDYSVLGLFIHTEKD